ncbi:MAG: response regulator [Roseburia sp.]
MRESIRYRDALPQKAVREEIEKGRGTQFEPEIADIMIQMIDGDKEYLMKQTDSMMKHILAVDDESMNLKLVEFALKDEARYRFYGAGSGQEALNVLDEEDIDLVLLDVCMPEMDGFETLVHIREKSNVPVVFMTADKQALELERGRALGVEDFITKPFMPAVLKEILHAILSE